MYALSALHRSEFLAVPELVRTTMTVCARGLEPTVLVKTLSLSVKLLVRSRELRFICVRLPGDYLAYGIRIDNDPDYPGVTWSVLKTEDERAALRMTTSSRCIVFLFNELLVNVAWAEFSAQPADSIAHWIEHANLYTEGDDHSRKLVQANLDAYTTENVCDGIAELELTRVGAWTEVCSTYITSRMKHSNISAFEDDEGGQQEELALWLMDSLDVGSAWKSPVVYHQKKSRELTDLLLNCRCGPVLLESKALSVLSRDGVPTRKHMSRALCKHIAKAERQMRGAMNSIKRNYLVSDESGREIAMERDSLVHAVVLVPDLALLAEARGFGGEFLKHFLDSTDGVLQILDLTELFRLVQAAETFEHREETGTRMEYFIVLFRARFRIALKQETPYFGFLLSESGSNDGRVRS